MADKTWLKALTKPWTLARKDAPVLSVDLINPGSYQRNDLQPGHWFWGPNGIELFFSYSGRKSAIKAYEKCPPISAIVNRKAQAYSTGKVFVVSAKDDSDEPTTDPAKRIRKLMTRPNPLQTWKQFDAQSYIYQQLFGYCPVLAIKPSGFTENIYTKYLWNLPPFMVDIKEADRLIYQTDKPSLIQSITLKYGQDEIPLEVNDVLIIRDFTVSMKSLLLPESRLLSLAYPINNIMGAYESRNVLINYRGALGILSPEKDQFGVAPINPDDKEELQKDFLRYGLSQQQWKFIISSAALKWQQMGIPTKDLLLMEEVVESTKQCCDTFNYPAQLLGIIDPKYDNWDAANKGLYQDAIIPETDSIYEQWTDFFEGEKHGLVIMKTFDHVAILQADQVKQATARLTLNQAKQIEWDNNLITLNEWIQALGDDPIPAELGDIRKSDTKTTVPLAVNLGVGGVQALIAVVTAQGMSTEAKQATLTALFGLDPTTAAAMCVAPEPAETTPPAGTGAPAPTTES